MGYYINTGTNLDKADILVRTYGAEKIDKPKNFGDIPADKALIVVVDNHIFEAAGLAYNEKEFQEFTLPTDRRRKEYLLMDKQLAYELTGFAGPMAESRTINC